MPMLKETVRIFKLSRNKKIRLLERTRENMRKIYDLMEKENTTTKKYDGYLAREKKLDHLEGMLRKYLGEYTYDPCPCNSIALCEDCTKFYKRRYYKGTYKSMTKCSETDPDRIPCEFLKQSKKIEKGGAQ